MVQPSPKYKLIVVCGPTGSGKTGFAIKLARQFNAEIIGADSMQIYRHMDIGTAKPTSAERAAVPHHMIDIVDPNEDFDAAAYADMAGGVVRQAMARGRIVFVVGGTGFYIKALIHGLFEKGPSDPAVCRRLKQQAESEGTAALARRLREIDPLAAERIHSNDTYRLIRALEVFEVTGESITVFHQRHGFREQRYNTLELGLGWPRPVLYDRINRRVDLMMAQGFLDEVRQLMARGYGSELRSMQSLGYRHLSAVVGGDTSLAEAVTMLKRDHRRYAKRQLTWFGARQSVHWLTPNQTAPAADRIRAFLS
ncbi:tRNA (adenosine(37)-N6)-dimethylallyltransferase MiaA [Desulfosarcina sp.]|uniref:tRNA (adenosine(37)-N6)-dimethylallyltransferase MiaA n=1 Tax=Desulfosarcina sp. TaxID=2027861 RepID=UPI0029AA7CA0|nr:tRNA (adenosine(37)-N6)-dimethylallyltransferase MiaA [Desulfosarcina sp.]MDX2454879.1 tRNA (adenosine(37)-N6)-dimethylallyltransferase MiaA [Desulfosarcina sp.]MDX2492473.1 tRNA (adenosine(37)-N6)-dimethylallyltransferase MiaA [Desulfosarcina sp.]